MDEEKKLYSIPVTQGDYETLLNVLEGLRARRELQDMRIAKEQAEAETHQLRAALSESDDIVERLREENGQLRQVIAQGQEVAKSWGWTEGSLTPPWDFLDNLLQEPAK